jgi:hypothetical protein
VTHEKNPNWTLAGGTGLFRPGYLSEHGVFVNSCRSSNEPLGYRSFLFRRIINAQLILGAFFAGLLISYFLGLSVRYKNNKIIKNLNVTLNSQMETISSLKSELSKYQGPTPQPDPQQSEVPVEYT